MGERLEPVEYIVDVDLRRKIIDKSTPNCTTAETNQLWLKRKGLILASSIKNQRPDPTENFRP